MTRCATGANAEIKIVFSRMFYLFCMYVVCVCEISLTLVPLPSLFTSHCALPFLSCVRCCIVLSLSPAQSNLTRCTATAGGRIKLD